MNLKEKVINKLLTIQEFAYDIYTNEISNMVKIFHMLNWEWYDKEINEDTVLETIKYLIGSILEQVQENFDGKTYYYTASETGGIVAEIIIDPEDEKDMSLFIYQKPICKEVLIELDKN